MECLIGEVGAECPNPIVFQERRQERLHGACIADVVPFLIMSVALAASTVSEQHYKEGLANLFWVVCI